LSHLKDLDEFAEACRYIQNHTLYTQALELYQYENARLKEIMRLYAEHLAATNKHRESAIAYEYLSGHANAWSEYKSANMWEESLSSASLAGVSEDELKNLAESLAEDLTASKSYHAASTVTLQYLSDLPSALRLLCRGSLFSSAIRLATLHKQPDLVEEVIDPGLIERSAEMTELLAEMKGQLGAQVPRLLELRKKKAEDPMAYLAGEVIGDGAVDIPDNLSVAPTETTSGGTFMTRYTNRSGTTGESLLSISTAYFKHYLPFFLNLSLHSVSPCF
jgi:elongator complex protein 1